MVFVLVWVAIALITVVLLFIITGLMNGAIVRGRLLVQLHVLIYGLDLTDHFDGEQQRTGFEWSTSGRSIFASFVKVKRVWP